MVTIDCSKPRIDVTKMAQFHNVCNVDQVPEGAARMFIVGETMIGVFHVDGKFFALDDHCPHAGASLAHGYLEGDVVRCRVHHWKFRVQDGVYLDEDKPECNVRTYAVRVVDEQIQVEV